MLSSFSIISNRNLKFIPVFLTATIILVFRIDESVGQDIDFPDRNQPGQQQNDHVSTSTKPPLECGPNMAPIVIEGIDEPFCDCVQGYLYYEKQDTCYIPYARGPCDEGKFLVLPANKVKAECVENTCKSDKVPYKGSCYSLLESDEACGANETLVVSEESFQPTCEGIEPVLYSVIRTPDKPCAAGSKRSGKDPRCLVIFDPPIGKKN